MSSSQPAIPNPADIANAEITKRIDGIKSKMSGLTADFVQRNGEKISSKLENVGVNAVAKVGTAVGRAIGNGSMALLMAFAGAFPGVGSVVSVGRGLDSVGIAAGKLVSVLGELVDEALVTIDMIKEKLHDDPRRDEMVDALIEVVSVSLIIIAQVARKFDAAGGIETVASTLRDLESKVRNLDAIGLIRMAASLGYDGAVMLLPEDVKSFLGRARDVAATPQKLREAGEKAMERARVAGENVVGRAREVATYPYNYDSSSVGKI